VLLVWVLLLLVLLRVLAVPADWHKPVPTRDEVPGRRAVGCWPLLHRTQLLAPGHPRVNVRPGAR
jgi:hypothetical protein